jgi:coenzyme F420-0:L-glutamate ligase / coenzyme F420-1:gamma-L-glutamate ligase
MMDADAFFEVIRSRRSVREFTDRVPDQQTIEQLIDAAQWAPSNHNRQGWRFIVFRDRVQLAGLAEKISTAVRETLTAANRLDAPNGKELLHYSTLFATAPVVILAMHKRSAAINRVLVEAGGGGKVSGEAISTAMAVENMLLAAHVLGLGACVMTAPLLAPGVWEKLENMPAGFQPTCVVAVGYPAQTQPAPRRKPLDQIVEFR